MDPRRDAQADPAPAAPPIAPAATSAPLTVWRQAAIFASGILLGAGVVYWYAQSEGGETKIAPARTAASAVAARTTTARPTTESTSCQMQPAVEESGVKDGQYEVKSDFSTNKASDVGAFLVIGKESAAAGRPRDAEVAFLMSCRLANQFQGEASIESADARYQLARHYAQAASLTPKGAYRTELVKRSELLYSESVKAYRTVVGEQHEKYRFASEGLAALNQQLAQAQTAQAPAAASSLPARPIPEVTMPPVAAKPVPAPRAANVAGAPRPSFNCAQARSISEKIICSDTELAELDRELGSLYVRAKNNASNPAAFKRQSDAQWLRREATCRDKECLMEWYAQRREQLIAQQER